MTYDKMLILRVFVPLAYFFHFSQAVKSSCMAPPVKLGDEATLSCHFETDISKHQHDVLVHLYKDYTEHPVVTYAWHDGQAKIHTVHGYRIEGHISDYLVIKITNVSDSNAGQYSCLVALSKDTHELCTLKIIDSSVLAVHKDHALHEHQDAENTLHIATVVLGVVFGVLVVIFLTILIIAIYTRWISIRCCTCDVNSGKEFIDIKNKFKKYIYNPPSTESKKTYLA